MAMTVWIKSILHSHEKSVGPKIGFLFSILNSCDLGFKYHLDILFA